MIKISFLGDIMCQKELVSAYQTQDGYDFSDVFSSIHPLLKQSDYVIGNLETPISIDNSALVNHKWEFNAPIEFAQAVKDAGVDFVSTANNHCLDRCVEGLNSTIESLDKVGLSHTGTFRNEKDNHPFYIEINGTKIGVLAYTYGTNAFGNHHYLKKNEEWKINLFQNQELRSPILRFIYTHGRLDTICGKLRKIVDPNYQRVPVYERKECSRRQERKLAQDITDAKENGADIVIVIAHIGGQYNSEPDSNTKYYSEFLRNNKVDIISGSHEHVVHGGRFNADSGMTAYSLGNFLTIDGVYSEPYNCKTNYSIVWHVYIEEKEIKKTSFTVVKCVESLKVPNGISIVPAKELLQITSATDKLKITKEILGIATKFSGIEYCDVYDEFPIYTDRSN